MKLHMNIANLEEAAKDTYENNETFVWNGLEIVVNKNIPLADVCEFVARVTSSCFDNGEYKPEYKDISIKVCILNYFANFTINSVTKKIYELVYSTNIIDSIIEHINHAQLGEILNYIDEKISATLRDKESDMNRRIEEAVSMFESVGEMMQTAFSGVDPEDVKKMVEAIGSGEIKADQVAKLYKDTAEE